ncbi:hypothetical protein VSR82_36970 [Burkholderia sp. JPY481]
MVRLLLERSLPASQEGVLQLQEPVLPHVRQEGDGPMDRHANGEAAANALAAHQADDALGAVGGIQAEPRAAEGAQRAN